MSGLDIRLVTFVVFYGSVSAWSGPGLLSGLESLSGIASLGRFSRRCLLTENPAAVLHDCVMYVSVARALRR